MADDGVIITTKEIYNICLSTQQRLVDLASKTDKQFQSVYNQIDDIKKVIDEDENDDEQRKQFSDKVKIAVISALIPFGVTGVIGLFVWLAKGGVFG